MEVVYGLAKGLGHHTHRTNSDFFPFSLRAVSTKGATSFTSTLEVHVHSPEKLL